MQLKTLFREAFTIKSKLVRIFLLLIPVAYTNQTVNIGGDPAKVQWFFSCNDINEYNYNHIYQFNGTYPKDELSSSWNGTTKCYYDPTCNGNLTFSVKFTGDCQSNISLHSFNQMLPILSYNTTSQPAFQSATIKIRQENFTNIWPGSSSENQVISFDIDKKVYIYPCQVFHLNMRSTSPDLPLCVDNWLFFTSVYQNSKIKSRELVTTDNSKQTTIQNLSTKYDPFSNKYSQIPSICTSYAYADHGAYNMEYLAVFTTETNSINKTAYLQYVFVQIGENQQSYQWSLKILSYSRNLTSLVYNWNWVTIGTYTGSQFIKMPQYSMAAQVAISPVVDTLPDPNQKLQVCSVQMFGLDYCDEVYYSWPAKCLQTDQIYEPLFLTFTMTQRLDNPLLDYCVVGMWFEVKINGFQIDNNTLSYDEHSMTFSYNLSFPQNIPVLKDNYLNILTYDLRYPRPLFTSGSMGAHIFTGACSEAILSAGKITLADGSWLMKYTQNTGVKKFKYELSCDCSISLSLSKVVFQIQGGPAVTDNYEQFTNCTLNDSSVCIYQNLNEQTLHIFGQETSKTDEKKILIIQATVTFVADDCSISGTKGPPTTQNFILEYTKCSDTSFKEIVVLTKSAGQPQTGLDLSTKIQDIFQPAQAEFQITDTYSFLMKPMDGLTACGQRSYAIQVDLEDANISIASELISKDCTSCLKVTSPGFTATLTALIVDRKYQNLTLSYVLNVGLSSQQNFGPTFQHKFKLQVEPYVISVQKPYFTQQLPKVQNITCGQNFSLPNITSPQNTSISINFTFGAASSFISVLNNKLIVAADCKGGSYPIDIALIDTQYNTKSIFTTILNITQIEKIDQSELQKILDSLLLTDESTQTKKNQSKATVTIEDKPRIAQIASVDRVGVLTLSFSQNLYVPSFLKNSTTSQQRTNLNSSAKFLTFGDYIGNNTLLINLKTQSGFEIVHWQCKNVEANLITIQLNFSKPLEVSANKPDYIQLKFLQPNLFLVQDRTNYFFTDQQSKIILTHQVPNQQASKSIAQQLQSAGEKSVQVGVVSLIVSLLIQLIAKKAISLMWIYFTCLQMNLLISSQANMVLPASASTLMQSISDTINLTALKDLDLLQYVKFVKNSNILGDSQFIRNLSGISICLAFVLLFGIFVLILSRFLNKKQIGYYIEKLKRLIFWNPVIRAFQGSYLNMQFSSYQSFFSSNNTSITDLIFASAVIFCQYQLVTLITAVLIFSNLTFLQKHKDSIGNLYKNLDLASKTKLFYSVVFLLSRSSIALILANKTSFGVQSALIQISITFNTAYIVSFNPYYLPQIQSQDFWSNWFLLAQFLIQLTTSAWNPTGASRYYYGFAYDAIVCMSFLINWIIILSQLQLVFKMKKTYYQVKKAYILRQNLQKKILSEKQELLNAKCQPKILDQSNSIVKIPISIQQINQSQNILQLKTISEQSEESNQSGAQIVKQKESETYYSEEQSEPQLYEKFVDILKEYDSGTTVPLKTKQQDAFSPRFLYGQHTTYDKKQTYLNMPEGFKVNYDYLPELLRPKPQILTENQNEVLGQVSEFTLSEISSEQQPIEEVKVDLQVIVTENDILNQIRERYGFPKPQ